jgi:hypothetical protein
LTSATSTFTYSSSNIPSGTNVIHLYTNNSNASAAVTASGNYGASGPFGTAYNYFKTYTGGPHIISLALGGPLASGSWDSGTGGAIYSIYQAVTKSGYSFGYTEYHNDGTTAYLTGTGKGTLNNNFNGLLFDIQQYSYGGSGSSGQDFLNLFQYIKYGTTSTFYDPVSGTSYQMIITVAFLHSGPYWGGYGTTLMKTILEDEIGNTSGKYSYNLLAPEFFTQGNLGKMNEYCSGFIPWTGSDSFFSYAESNTNFQTYNVNMITPLLVSANLFTTSGSNTSGNPNNYWFQSSGPASSIINPPTATNSGYVTIPYTTDTGSKDFFNTVFASGVTSSGGYVQWMNGTLS